MRSKNIIALALVCVLLGLGIQSCKDNSHDEALDDLVQGLYFGMEKDVFFKHCWDLNQEGITGHGTLNNNVMYEDSVNFDPLVVVNFYPEFVDDKIAELPMSFYFKGWSPWTKKELNQNRLKEQVLKFFQKKYGPDFKEKKLPNGDIAYYKVMKPVTIRIYNDVDEMLVKADIKNENFQKK